MDAVRSVLIVGMGRFGRHAARKMYELHRQVMAVEKDEECINAALKKGEDLQMTITPDTVFASGDKILALGKNDEILKRFR